MRLDHLLSKEPIARCPRHSLSGTGSSHVDHWLFGRTGTLRPPLVTPSTSVGGRTDGHHRGTERGRTSLFRCEGDLPDRFVRSTCRPAACRAVGASSLRDFRSRRSSPCELASLSCPAWAVHPYLHRYAARLEAALENCRASTSILKFPSYKGPTVDALAPDADEGRGWLR